jgi:hypothetical protein
MARIKMRDTTATADTGSLRAGEVYEVSDEIADRLIAQGLASKTTAQTTADRQAELAADEDQPTIEEQAAAAGTKPGDQATTSDRTPQPLNEPPASSARERSR